MQARISAVAELYDVISRSTSTEPVLIGPYLEGIAANLRSSLLGENSRVIITTAAEPLAIGAEHAVTVGLVVNELATNAVKHALPIGTGQIVLSFGRRDGEVMLAVSDDGICLSAAGIGNVASGLGSRFVEVFVRQLDGTLATASGTQGTTFTVRLPATILADPQHTS